MSRTTPTTRFDSHAQEQCHANNMAAVMGQGDMFNCLLL